MEAGLDHRGSISLRESLLAYPFLSALTSDDTTTCQSESCRTLARLPQKKKERGNVCQYSTNTGTDKGVQ